MSDSKMDPWTHAPLPYRVVLRAAITQDGRPQRIERKVLAYSVAEAMIQAVMETTGEAPGLAEAKYEVEAIQPDLAAFYELMGERLLAEVKR